jgi:hypothetical protein
VEELGRRSTDVLDYEESDSGVRFVLSDRGQAWSLFRKYPLMSTWASHEYRGRLVSIIPWSLGKDIVLTKGRHWR